MTGPPLDSASSDYLRDLAENCKQAAGSTGRSADRLAAAVGQALDGTWKGDGRDAFISFAVRTGTVVESAQTSLTKAATTAASLAASIDRLRPQAVEATKQALEIAVGVLTDPLGHQDAVNQMDHVVGRLNSLQGEYEQAIKTAAVAFRDIAAEAPIGLQNIKVNIPSPGQSGGSGLRGATAVPAAYTMLMAPEQWPGILAQLVPGGSTAVNTFYYSREIMQKAFPNNKYGIWLEKKMLPFEAPLKRLRAEALRRLNKAVKQGVAKPVVKLAKDGYGKWGRKALDELWDADIEDLHELWEDMAKKNKAMGKVDTYLSARFREISRRLAPVARRMDRAVGGRLTKLATGPRKLAGAAYGWDLGEDSAEKMRKFTSRIGSSRAMQSEVAEIAARGLGRGGKLTGSALKGLLRTGSKVARFGPLTDVAFALIFPSSTAPDEWHTTSIDGQVIMFMAVPDGLSLRSPAAAERLARLGVTLVHSADGGVVAVGTNGLAVKEAVRIMKGEESRRYSGGTVSSAEMDRFERLDRAGDLDQLERRYGVKVTLYHPAKTAGELADQNADSGDFRDYEKHGPLTRQERVNLIVYGNTSGSPLGQLPADPDTPLANLRHGGPNLYYGTTDRVSVWAPTPEALRLAESHLREKLLRERLAAR